MSVFRLSKEYFASIEAFKQEHLVECKEQFSSFEANTLGLKEEQRAEMENLQSLTFNEQCLNEIVSKVPSDFKERLEKAS